MKSELIELVRIGIEDRKSPEEILDAQLSCMANNVSNDMAWEAYNALTGLPSGTTKERYRAALVAAIQSIREEEA